MGLEIREERARPLLRAETIAPERADANAVSPLDRLEPATPPALIDGPPPLLDALALPRRETAPVAVAAIADATLGSATPSELRELAHAIAESQCPDGSWEPQDGAPKLDTQVMHHFATLALLRSDAMTPHLRARLDATLAASWVNLTGSFRAPDKMHDRLPWRQIMRHTEVATGAMEKAVFSGKRDDLYHALRAINRRPSAREINNVMAAMTGLLSKVDSDFGYLNRVHAVVADVLQDVAKPAAQFAAGMIASHIIASMTDHHALPEKEGEWPRMKIMGDALKQAYAAHAKSDAPVPGPKGLALDKVIRFLTPGTPVYAAVVAGALTVGAHPITYIGLGIPAVFVPLTSKILHPYFDMPREEAMAKAGPIMRAFLRTEVARYLSRRHFVHHARPQENVNFNLIPGADVLLGRSRHISPDELAEMRRLGLIC